MLSAGVFTASTSTVLPASIAVARRLHALVLDPGLTHDVKGSTYGVWYLMSPCDELALFSGFKNSSHGCGIV